MTADRGRDMACHRRTGNKQVVTALAAITGAQISDIADDLHAAKSNHQDKSRADLAEVAKLVDQIKTRLGIAPAVDAQTARDLRADLDGLRAVNPSPFTRSDIAAWASILSGINDHVPTVARIPVTMPSMPPQQHLMWDTLLDLDEHALQTGSPWVLVGGQMTVLHCLEHNQNPVRATDDGDIAVGVWTNRDALGSISHALRRAGYTESDTSGEYGYRYSHPERAVIDLLIPDNMQRQHRRPKTATGRPGLPTPGANQAITRAERVPLELAGRHGHVRRPNLLGAIIAKAYAYRVDQRDPQRHLEDLAVLASFAARTPKLVIEQARSADRKAVRAVMNQGNDVRRISHLTEDPDLVVNFLTRLSEPLSTPRRK